MVLNLSDQDSTHQSPNEGSADNASMPSPEARLDMGRSPVHHAPYLEREGGRQSVHSQEDSNGDDSQMDDAPIDFSVRRQENGGVKRENNSKDVAERRSPNGFKNYDNFHRSPITPEHMSPGKASYRSEEKIGEPKLALPGLPPGMPLPPFPGQLPPGFPLNMMAHFNMVNNLPMCNEPKSLNNGHDKSNARPFKAYPKDPLSLPLGYFGLPGVAPLPGIDVASAQAFSQANTEEMFKHYRDYVIKRIEQERHEKRKSPLKNENDLIQPISPASPGRTSSQISPNAPIPLLSMHQPQWPQQQPSPPTRASQPSVITANPLKDVKPPVTPSQDSLTPKSPNSSLPPRKRSRSNSDGTVVKDGAYWERRRKNNEAAKRSRDSRRAKEDEIAIRAAFLEQENLKLRVEVTALKNETAKLRCMLYNS